MKITVLGGSGRTGSEIIKQGLEAGYEVTVLARREDSVARRKGLTIQVGDTTDAKDVANASKGADVIISTLGTMSGTLMTDAVAAVVEASKASKVKRFILMSSYAVQKEQLGGGTKFLTNLLMGNVVKDKEASEELLRSSDLEWTIVYATSLTSSPKGAKVRVLKDSEKVSLRHKIARADVAAWILKEAKKKDYIKQDVTISE